MLTDIQPHGTGRERRRASQLNFGSLFLGIGRIIGVAVLFFLFYLLMHSMVEHRFFRGGEMGHNGHLQQ
jgi:hypothetical protein